MSDKKAYSVGGQPTAGYVPAPPQQAYGVAGGYGVFPPPGAPLYAAQGPPPSYDQSLTHPAAQAQAAASQQMYAAQMYAQAAQAQRAEEAGHQWYGEETSEDLNQAYCRAKYLQQYLLQAQGYPAGYLGYPAYSPMQAYYPSLAYTYPGIQQPQMRQTIMVPNGFDAGARFDGVSAPVIPGPPPGVAPSAAQLAAMAGHNVALTQKKGSFLSGGSDGGYTFW